MDSKDDAGYQQRLRFGLSSILKELYMQMSHLTLWETSSNFEKSTWNIVSRRYDVCSAEQNVS